MYRSRRYDHFEKFVLALLLQGPFRCLDCHERHYNFVFSRKIKPEISAHENAPGT